jgi:predicted dehydrogenase
VRATRWGILGTGNAARAFARGLRLAPGAELRAVASRQLETSRRFAQLVGAPRFHATYEALVADPEIDVIHVATPGFRHRDDCLLCLLAGKPVLCEKPFSICASDARDVVETARERKVFCMEAMWMRFMPLVQRARALIREGAIGEVQMLVADFALPTPPRADGRVERPPGGGGALLERGVYLLSLADFLMGPPISAAGSAALTDEGFDSHSAYLLRYESGVAALLWASLTTRGSNEAVIVGTHGTIRLHEPFYRPHRMSLSRSTSCPEAVRRSRTGTVWRFLERLKENRFAQHASRRLPPMTRRPALDVLEPVAGNGYQYEALEVMRCLQSGRLESPIMPLAESLQIMELIDRIQSDWQPR